MAMGTRVISNANSTLCFTVTENKKLSQLEAATKLGRSEYIISK
jgi:hypothetical protein